MRWYLAEIEAMLAGRQPLAGPVSNIASWNYPLSVLVHAMLVQLLAGDAVIAKTPTDGGLCALTLATALMRRCELPVTLVSGSGSRLSPALVLSDDIGCLAFVGGRDAGGQIASQLVQTDKRHMLEQEGLNAWGIWEFSDWDTLAGHLKKGFEYGKQRCTAYPRYVVQRSLFDRFLAMYLPVVRSLRFGHPLAVAEGGDQPPDLDFGPLINAAKVTELTGEVDLAVQMAATPLHRGTLEQGWFLPGQDTSAYLPPVALLDPPGASALGHAEPFGPVDTVVLVDSAAELVAEMNASNGCLVASIASDDEHLARRLADQVHAFKVGINRPRSRGDKAEPFGRPRRLLEGRLRGRRAPGPRRHPGTTRRTAVRQLPRPPALPAHLRAGQERARTENRCWTSGGPSARAMARSSNSWSAPVRRSPCWRRCSAQDRTTKVSTKW